MLIKGSDDMGLRRLFSSSELKRCEARSTKVFQPRQIGSVRIFEKLRAEFTELATRWTYFPTSQTEEPSTIIRPIATTERHAPTFTLLLFYSDTYYDRNNFLTTPLYSQKERREKKLVKHHHYGVIISALVHGGLCFRKCSGLATSIQIMQPSSSS